jgi:uncharacterized protein YndB with AHSA1/START domain
MSKSITLSKTYHHPIDKVWGAITDPEAMSEWLMSCDFQPQIGYEFNFTTKPGPGFDGIVRCKVLELNPPNLLVFSWSGGSLVDTLVTFKLTAVTQDQTRLDFEHSGFEGFINNLIVKRILANGWKSKILKVQLLKYLDNE